jgi:CheY-like chemotaxis protein
MQNLRQSLWSQNGRANKRRVSHKGTPVATIRILLADDSEAMLADLREELSKEFEIIGTAGNGEEAVQAVLHLDPDVLVIDIAMPVFNGIQASSSIRNIHPRTKILFLTINEQAEYISAAFSARGRHGQRWGKGLHRERKNDRWICRVGISCGIQES